VRELELMQEAGFHPLEVIRSATSQGAALCGIENELGTLEVWCVSRDGTNRWKLELNIREKTGR